MNYFFVFQNKTYDEESKGGYLWAPKKGNNGRKVSHWDKMRKVKAGDVIIHSYFKKIKAISIAKADCYSADRPVELIDEWNNDGWRVDTTYYHFENCIITSDYMEKLLLFQPEKDAPFNSIGRGNTGFLFDASEEMFKLIFKKSLELQESEAPYEDLLSILKNTSTKTNIPEIRIIPMSGEEEFPSKTIGEIQEEFFLNDLSQRDMCPYKYRKKGINSPNNSLILFQLESKIIASARLDKIDVLSDPYYKGAINLYPDSIQVFEPITYDELKCICPDLSRFSQSKQRLNSKYADDIIDLILEKSQKYFLLDKEMKVKQDVSEKVANKLNDEELKKRIKNNKGTIGKIKSESTVYYRDPYVKEFVKRQANGKCQLCGVEAPFADKHGNPFLEVHHIKWLSKGGDDSVDNAAALCPNCHRKMHILNLKKDKKKLKETLQILN